MMETNIQDNETNYLQATRLMTAIRCMTRDKDKAHMYRSIAKIYKALGDYKDSAELYAECMKKAEACTTSAAEYEKKTMEAGKPVISDNKKDKKHIFKKIMHFIGILIIVLAIGSIIYLKTEPGRYARASFYEKTGNYQKSYKMFNNLKTYKDSANRSAECRYKYASESFADKHYETARKAYSVLGDYKDSEQMLSSTEIEIIKNAKIGDNILFGGYHWMVTDKEKNKVLLVKALPIQGFAYNNENKDVTWENCSLRSYLNNEFLEETFNDSMITSILDTKIKVPDNAKYGTTGGDATTDKIFLLNAKQFKKYSDILSNYLRDCWLINPGNTQSTAQFVSYGEIMDDGYNVTNTTIHIRPALWVTVD